MAGLIEETATGENPQYCSVAPWWHTALLVALLLGVSLLGSLRPAHPTLSQHHVMQYLLTTGWEWALAGLVFWGIRMRGVPLRQLLGVRRPQWRDWRNDLGLALTFWIAASIVLSAIGILLKLGHFSMPQKTIVQLAPENSIQLLLWIVLSISAGICEELVFRGYLLQQLSSGGKHLWTGVIVSSLLFGVSHGYERASGMIAITVYGAMFCGLANRRGSLRAGMIAHAWHDIFSGIALMLLRHSRLL